MKPDRTGRSELTIADLAHLPVASTASRIRRELALEALSDPSWVALDERRRERRVPAAEDLPVMPLPVVLAAHGQYAVTEERPLERRRPVRGGVRATLATAIGAVYGAFLVLNTRLPDWYAGWADFGPAVTWRGTSLVGATLAVMYALGTHGLNRTMRPAVDTLALTYVSFALHWSVSAFTLAGALAAMLVPMARRRSAARRDAARVRATVTRILSEPLEDGGEYQVRWGRFVGNVAEAADILCARALELDGHDLDDDFSWHLVHDIGLQRSVEDTAACVLAAEIWMIACDATEFEQAASLGPATLGAYAAILARSRHEASPELGPLPGEPAWPATEPVIAAKVAALRSWYDRQPDASAFPEVLARAASDLVTFGGGDDRCSRAARMLETLATGG